MSQTEIADQIGVHKSTISRELKRNVQRRGQTAGRYIVEHAQRKTDYRHSNQPKQILLGEELKRRIEGLMKYEKWSPELIANRLAKESEFCASHETIYKWIWMSKHSNHKSALLVMIDRTTLVTMLEKLHSKNADEVYLKMNKRLTNFNSSWIKTITFDNGKEFAHHHKIAEGLKAKTYFTRPYTSQDKRTVENRIGVIRRFFPKKTDLREVSVKRIKELERLLNYRPIRKFNYNNPIEVLNN